MVPISLKEKITDVFKLNIYSYIYLALTAMTCLHGCQRILFHDSVDVVHLETARRAASTPSTKVLQTLFVDSDSSHQSFVPTCVICADQTCSWLGSKEVKKRCRYIVVWDGGVRMKVGVPPNEVYGKAPASHVTFPRPPPLPQIVHGRLQIVHYTYQLSYFPLQLERRGNTLLHS